MKFKDLDSTNEHILEILKKDGRAAYSAIGKQVGLSPPAVKERILKMEDAGLIEGYTIRTNEQALGFGVRAFMLIDVPGERDRAFAKFISKQEGITECFHILGDQAFILRISLRNMEELEALIQGCLKFGKPTTYMLLSQIK